MRFTECDWSTCQVKKNKLIKLRVARKEKSERILKASSQSCCNTMLGTQSKKSCQKDFYQHCLDWREKTWECLNRCLPVYEGFLWNWNIPVSLSMVNWMKQNSIKWSQRQFRLDIMKNFLAIRIITAELHPLEARDGGEPFVLHGNQKQKEKRKEKGRECFLQYTQLKWSYLPRR